MTTADKLDEGKLKILREAGLLPKHAESLLEEGMPTSAIVVELTDGPRTGVVRLSTILKTGKLTARENLDAQAEIDAKHKPIAAKPAPASPAPPPADKAPALSSPTKPATTPPLKADVKADSEQKETTVKTRTATAAKRSRKPSTAKKPAGERRKVKSDNARKPVEKKPKQPKGQVVEILKLAGRANGVSRAELIALTKWEGAPWKWLFKNKNKTGYCDRWGYTFEVLEGKDGETRYHVKKKD